MRRRSARCEVRGARCEVRGAVLQLPESPLVPGVSPVRIRYRECGRGAPLLFLHGGWGYEIYPFDRQIAALADRHRIVIPDRSGYGGFRAVRGVAPEFSPAAAGETPAPMRVPQVQGAGLVGHTAGEGDAAPCAARG